MQLVEEVEFTFIPRIEEGAGGWSAFCDQLHMASCGRTQEDAETNLTATLQALVRALRRSGILEKTLDEAGLTWKRVETTGVRVVA